MTYTAVNTDRQALSACLASRKILLESGGQDAGGRSELGHQAAVEACEQLVADVQGADVVVIIACLGGGTGSGAAPLLAEIAKSLGCLTVAVGYPAFGSVGSNGATGWIDAAIMAPQPCESYTVAWFATPL